MTPDSGLKVSPRQFLRRSRRDVSGNRDLKTAFDPVAFREISQIFHRDGGNGGDIAIAGKAIRMAIEEELGKGAPGHDRRTAPAFLDALDHLGAHPRHGFGVEARTCQRRLQQTHRQRRIFGQGDHRNHHIVAPHIGAELNGVVRQRFLKSTGVHVACAFIEQGGGECRQPRLFGRIVSRARRHADGEGDNGNGMVLAEPDFGFLAQIERLDVGGRSRRRCQGGRR